jgi:hypothetical protein
MPRRRSRPRQFFILATVTGLTVAGAVAAEASYLQAAPTAGARTLAQAPISDGYELDTPEASSTRRRRPRPTPTATVAPTVPATVSPTATPTTATPTTAAPPPGVSTGPAPADVPNVGLPDGTSLTPMREQTITQSGTVINAADIDGPVVIDAENVVIRRSRISGTGDLGIYVRRGSLTLEDSTIQGFDNSMGGDRYTATRVEVTGANEDGFKIGSNVTIQDSWCHGLLVTNGAHSDCGQVQSGVTNVVIRRNWFDGEHGNSALFIAPDQGPSSPGPLLVENNVLGGGNYTMQCVDGAYGRFLIGNITIRGNQFLGNSEYGPIRTNVFMAFLSNVFRATGLPILL